MPLYLPCDCDLLESLIVTDAASHGRSCCLFVGAAAIHAGPHSSYFPSSPSTARFHRSFEIASNSDLTLMLDPDDDATVGADLSLAPYSLHFGKCDPCRDNCA